jgi:uncharacterized membrane protein
VVAGFVALVAALGLSRVRPEDGPLTLVWRGDLDATSDTLTVVATAVMTAITLTFSVTVVALQLASQQFSPRLLRDFVRDPVTRQVLAVLTGTFVFTITTVGELRADEPVPVLAARAGMLLGVASLGAIVVFIAHITSTVRVDTMMVRVHDETDAAIDVFYPPYDDDGGGEAAQITLDDEDGWMVTATRSGFVQLTDVAELLGGLAEHDALARIEVRAGDHVVRGTPLATAWCRGADDRAAREAVEEVVRAAVALGFERTLDQDTGFGFRQLEDIAVKAVSPSVNDPVTAAHAVGHMGDLLVRLTRCRLGPTLHRDAEGVDRALVPDRDLRYYLELTCGQLRRFGRDEPTVIAALLRMLRDVAVWCRDESQRDEVRRAARLILDEAHGADLADADRHAVDRLGDRVELALAGDVRAAFADRAGETRSL